MPTTPSDADRHFPGERERAEAIKDIERMLAILDTQSAAFRRKVKVVELAAGLGVPVHLHKALETVLYDTNQRRRKMAGKLIVHWARRGE